MFSVRPYAALICVTALGVVVYDAYQTRRTYRGEAPIWPLVAVLLFASTIHMLALVYVTAIIAAGEVQYWRANRRIDKRVLLAFLYASPGFLLDFSLSALVAARYTGQVPLSAKMPGLPTLAKLHEVIEFPAERTWQKLLLAALAITALLSKRTAGSTGATQPDSGRQLSAPTLSAIAIYCAGGLAFGLGVMQHYFFSRYASPLFLVGALLVGQLLSFPIWRRFPAIPVAIALILLSLPLLKLRASAQSAAAEFPSQQLDRLFQHGETIVASPLTAPTLWWYATPEQRGRMIVVTDAQRFLSLPDGIPEGTIRRLAESHLLPFPLTDYKHFTPGNKVVIVRPLTSGDTWLPSALQLQGFRCTLEEPKAEGFVREICLR